MFTLLEKKLDTNKGKNPDGGCGQKNIADRTKPFTALLRTKAVIIQIRTHT